VLACSGPPSASHDATFLPDTSSQIAVHAAVRIVGSPPIHYDYIAHPRAHHLHSSGFKLARPRFASSSPHPQRHHSLRQSPCHSHHLIINHSPSSSISTAPSRVSFHCLRLQSHHQTRLSTTSSLAIAQLLTGRLSLAKAHPDKAAISHRRTTIYLPKLQSHSRTPLNRPLQELILTH
jgi:hypothetical protein